MKVLSWWPLAIARNGGGNHTGPFLITVDLTDWFPLGAFAHELFHRQFHRTEEYDGPRGKELDEEVGHAIQAELAAREGVYGASFETFVGEMAERALKWPAYWEKGLWSDLRKGPDPAGALAGRMASHRSRARAWLADNARAIEKARRRLGQP